MTTLSSHLVTDLLIWSQESPQTAASWLIPLVSLYTTLVVRIMVATGCTLGLSQVAPAVNVFCFTSGVKYPVAVVLGSNSI